MDPKDEEESDSLLTEALEFEPLALEALEDLTGGGGEDDPNLLLHHHLNNPFHTPSLQEILDQDDFSPDEDDGDDADDGGGGNVHELDLSSAGSGHGHPSSLLDTLSVGSGDTAKSRKRRQNHQQTSSSSTSKIGNQPEKANIMRFETVLRLLFVILTKNNGPGVSLHMKTQDTLSCLD